MAAAALPVPPALAPILIGGQIQPNALPAQPLRVAAIVRYSSNPRMPQGQALQNLRAWMDVQARLAVQQIFNVPNVPIAQVDTFVFAQHMSTPLPQFRLGARAVYDQLNNYDVIVVQAGAVFYRRVWKQFLQGRIRGRGFFPGIVVALNWPAPLILQVLAFTAAQWIALRMW